MVLVAGVVLKCWGIASLAVYNLFFRPSSSLHLDVVAASGGFVRLLELEVLAVSAEVVLAGGIAVHPHQA